MSAKMTSLYREQSETQSVWIFRETFAATGLTASGANTVPFPSPLPTVASPDHFGTAGMEGQREFSKEAEGEGILPAVAKKLSA
jgi:hypothetical protein